MLTPVNKLGQLIDAYKNLSGTNFDSSGVSNEIKSTLRSIMNERQIISYNGIENLMKSHNIDIGVLNNVTGILNLDHLKDWGPDDRYFIPDELKKINEDVTKKVYYENDNTKMLKKKRLNIKLEKQGKVISNVQKYIRWKNDNNESKINILNILEEKVKKYKEAYNITKEKKNLVIYERLRKELQRTRNKIKDYDDKTNSKITKYIYNFPYNQKQKISNRNDSKKSFLVSNIYKKTSKYFSKKHDFYNRSIAKTDLKLVYNEIHSKIIKTNVMNDERKRLFNYLMNHFLKYFNMHYYGNQCELKEINEMNFKEKECNRNRTLTSFYNNLNVYIDNLLEKNQTYGKLEHNAILRSSIVNNDMYKVCYVQFLKLMIMESNLAFTKLDVNNRLDKIRQDYYNNSFFVSSLKRKELLENFYSKVKLNENDKFYLQKTLSTFSPFRLPNSNSVALLPNQNFPTNVTNILNTNIMIQVIDNMSKDNKNLSPVDIFYSYGIPIKDISEENKRKIGFNKVKKKYFY